MTESPSFKVIRYINGVKVKEIPHMYLENDDCLQVIKEARKRLFATKNKNVKRASP